MSFDTEVIKQGRGRAIRVDISTDNFATILHRYSDVAGELDGSNMYSARVLEMGSVKRAFGNNRIAASSTTSLRLANADGGVDWICGRENIGTAARARLRIYVVLYEAGAAESGFVSKMLGEFVLSSWPTQNNTAVDLQLADDFMGKLGAGLLLPTIADWAAVGDATNNPFVETAGLPPSLSVNTPIQLAFGEDVLLALPHIIPQGNNGVGDTYEGKIIVPLYSTTDTGAVSQDLVSQIIVESYPIPTSLDEPDGGDPLLRTVFRSVIDPVTFDSVTVWTVEKSPTITKNGLNFQIVYLVVRGDVGNISQQYFVQAPGNPTGPAAWEAKLSTLQNVGGYQQDAIWSAGNGYRFFGSKVLKWYARIIPGSQRTNAPSFGPSHPVDVMRDLVSVYSSATVDTTSASRVKAGSPFAACSGVVQAWTERANTPNSPPPPMSLRQVLTELAQSSDFDVFINWSGLIAFSSDVWDFTTATQATGLLAFSEADLSSMTRWVPSNGERGAPFNRVYFEGGKSNPSNEEDVPFQGPFDLADAEVPTSVMAIEMSLRQGWRPFRQQALDPWKWRSVDGVTRDRIRFRTNIGGLRLELGQYFRITWTRGSQVAGPYNAGGLFSTGVIFQCEAITYSPTDDVVEIEAVWRDDTSTERQYLLDDETLLVRTKPMSADLLLYTDSGYTFASTGVGLNFFTMGVQNGDILVLRDSTQAADVFSRNRAIRIDFLDDDFTLVLDTADTSGIPAAPSTVTVANADWSIVRGATTYPTAVSDPTNYPSGGDMYGKTTASDGTYSNSETGNRLISG